MSVYHPSSIQAGPDYSPHESAKSSNSTHHGTTTLEQNSPLLNISLRETRLAVDGASVVNTASHIDINVERSSSRGHGSKCSQPHDDEEGIENGDGQNVVRGLPGGDLFG